MTTTANKGSGKIDPRFRRISKKATKVVVDKRFQSMFEEEQFVTPVSVDKYGRPLEVDREKRELERFYRLDGEDQEKERTGEGEDKKLRKDDDISKGNVGSKVKAPAVVTRLEVQCDSDSLPSSDSTDTEGESEEAEEDNIMDEALSAHPLVIRDVPMGEATRRLALVNMDWDQITAEDIYTLVYGFKPLTGSIKTVTIYPSRFGKERMAREDLEGPPRELFDDRRRSSDNNSEEDDDSESLPRGRNRGQGKDRSNKGKEPRQTASETETEDESEYGDGDGGEGEVDEDGVTSRALRRYQLERLRYYYAVIECDSVETAHHIYQHCDGSEFEKSANFLDLRFVPDSVTFSPEEDGPVRDVATELPKNYRSKPDISTAALQSTRVTLTWDADDAGRVRVMRRAPLKGEEQEEADLRAYLASASSDDEEVGGEDDENRDRGENHKANLNSIEKYRSLIREPVASVFGRKGETKDLSITFASALRTREDEDEDNKEVEMEMENSSDIDQEATFGLDGDDCPALVTDKTPFEKYLERRKAKRQARREAAKAAKEAAVLERRQRRKGKSVEERQAEDAERQRLSLLLSDADNDRNDEDVTRKQAKRMADEVDLEDERFAAIYEESEYALDPSHPAFKRNKSTEKIIKERQRRRQYAERK